MPPFCTPPPTPFRAAAPVDRQSLDPLWILPGHRFIAEFLSEGSPIVERMLDSVVTPAVTPLVLPDDVARLPPGPGLAGVVASVDRSRLAALEVFEVMAAHQRLIAHYQAALLADLYEAGRLIPGEGVDPLARKPDLDRFSGMSRRLRCGGRWRRPRATSSWPSI
jgi:hypothetical protein